MAFRFEYTDRVQFAETDLAGIVHFSNFFRYLERAEHAFFRSLELNIAEGGELPPGIRVGWPRVHASCDYHRPLRFQDIFKVELLVEEVRTKSIRYLYRIWSEDHHLCAEGRIAVVCIRRNEATGEMHAVEIPERITAKIEAAPEHLLKRPRS